MWKFRGDEQRVPANTSMTTNGSTQLQFQYNEFLISVHPRPAPSWRMDTTRVKSGMKFACHVAGVDGGV